MNQSNRVLLCSAFLALTVTHSGCAVNPVSGNREVVLLSVEGEKEIGAENAKQVKKEMGLFEDPALLKYVQSIGDRLASYSPYQEISYQFQIVDSEEPNAFALPGGYVYVSRGLLVLLNSEDELAGVIGHEIGHVAARHGVQRLTRAAPIGLVTGITSAAVGIVSSSLANIVSGTGSLLNSAILAPYSRGQENDADAIGQELAAKAGWDPAGITLFLNTLDREALRNGNKNKGIPFLSTHPSTPERVRKTEQRASEIEYKKTKLIANNHATFLARLDGLIVGTDARQGVVIGQDFLHPTMQIGMTFPPNWEIVNHSEYVAASDKQQSAGLILQLDSEGTDPYSAAQAFVNEANLGNQAVKKITIAGLPASQIALDTRGQKATITFIAFKGDIYRLISISNNSKANYQQLLKTSISTFHQLSSVEMTRIQQQRLRIVSAKNGESIAVLLKRVDSVWDEESCVVANNLQAGVSLKNGQLIKVLMSETFR
ncbi:MAG: M48 family metalloprotease [Methyloprofundus sp.]|nr:M48 family metalloprotease [Methyloprofundus sp.]